MILPRKSASTVYTQLPSLLDLIVVDHSKEIVNLLLNIKTDGGMKEIVIITSNVGAELFTDLLLGHLLLSLRICVTVRFIVSSYPIYTKVTRRDLLGSISILADPQKSDVWTTRHFGEGSLFLLLSLPSFFSLSLLHIVNSYFLIILALAMHIAEERFILDDYMSLSALVPSPSDRLDMSNLSSSYAYTKEILKNSKCALLLIKGVNNCRQFNWISSFQNVTSASNVPLCQIYIEEFNDNFLQGFENTECSTGSGEQIIPTSGREIGAEIGVIKLLVNHKSSDIKT